MEKSPFFIWWTQVALNPGQNYSLPMTAARSRFSAGSMGRTDRAGDADQPVRPDQDTGFAGLRPQREADSDQSETEQQAYGRNASAGFYNVRLTS